MLIAAVGLAGAGKTTALGYLSRAGVGDYEYVGAYLRAAVIERGLAPTPENERKVRADLRDRRGMAAIAELALPELRRKTTAGHVLVDAIYNEEERGFYLDALGADLMVVGLEAPTELRAKRLAHRSERPMSKDELLRRDRYELETLRLGDVVARADLVLRNDGTLADLEDQLVALAAHWRG